MSAYIDQKTERRTIPTAFGEGYIVGFDDGEYDLYAEAEWKIGWTAGQSDLKLMRKLMSNEKEQERDEVHSTGDRARSNGPLNYARRRLTRQ